jgi:hypothetical protein
MRVIDVKYKLGPEDAGLSEDEIARKVGDMCIEFEEAFDFMLNREWDPLMKKRRQRKKKLRRDGVYDRKQDATKIRLGNQIK